ncbi:hypothetical protein [Arthrobacter sp. Marseille-P9274]|uniref:hypothetical protein n=1 Tax=Arthrobacter sp. Marseille-P9274 TaxID=2866572 RepID=UPI0021C8E890|nr:hypothetical protein [Arthrobacter sp. Marseille-P9274]
MLNALAARSAEVESAEWALDQSVSVRNEQIVAAMTAGVPVERVEAASGLTVSELEQILAAQVPAAKDLAPAATFVSGSPLSSGRQVKIPTAPIPS